MTYRVADTMAQMHSGITEANSGKGCGETAYFFRLPELGAAHRHLQHLVHSMMVLLIFGNAWKHLNSGPQSPHRENVRDWVAALVSWTQVRVCGARRAFLVPEKNLG